MKYLFADIILTIGVCIMFGSGLAAIKASFYGFGVFTAVALRFFVASVTIFLWIKVTRKSIRIESEHFLKIFIWTGIFLVEYFLLFFDVRKTSASRASLIINLQPFFVIFSTHYFIVEEKIGFRKIFGMIVGFCGLLPLFKVSEKQRPRENRCACLDPSRFSPGAKH